MPTKQKTLKRAPVAYHIKVNVETDGTFKYSAPGIPDASSIRPRNGDTISWSVSLRGVPGPFQVEFPGFSPFGTAKRVIRSMYQETDPLTVAVPSFYHGNLVFKYTVSIGNSWSDDPDVEPVVSDGLLNTIGAQVISLSIDGNGNLTLDQPNASFDKGEVLWRWSGDALDDFKLTFDSPVPQGPPAWPAVTASQARRIDLVLTAPADEAGYTIETVNLGLAVDGELTIS